MHAADPKIWYEFFFYYIFDHSIICHFKIFNDENNIGTPKCKKLLCCPIIFFFQFGDSNIGLLSIAPCKVIDLNLPGLFF